MYRCVGQQVTDANHPDSKEYTVKTGRPVAEPLLLRIALNLDHPDLLCT